MRIDLKYSIDRRIVAKDLGRPRLGDPIDLGMRKGTPSVGQSRKSVDNVADGSELDEKYLHVKTMLPKIDSMSEPLFCSVPEHI